MTEQEQITAARRAVSRYWYYHADGYDIAACRRITLMDMEQRYGLTRDDAVKALDNGLDMDNDETRHRREEGGVK